MRPPRFFITNTEMSDVDEDVGGRAELFGNYSDDDDDDDRGNFERYDEAKNISLQISQLIDINKKDKSKKTIRQNNPNVKNIQKQRQSKTSSNKSSTSNSHQSSARGSFYEKDDQKGSHVERHNQAQNISLQTSTKHINTHEKRKPKVQVTKSKNEDSLCVPGKNKHNSSNTSSVSNSHQGSFYESSYETGFESGDSNDEDESDGRKSEEIEKFSDAQNISLQMAMLIGGRNKFGKKVTVKKPTSKSGSNSNLLNVPVLKKRRKDTSSISSACNSDQGSFYESDASLLSISTPTADRNSKLDDSNGKRPDSRTNGTGSGLSRKSELPPVTTESDATRIDYMKSITSSRPPSGKKPRPITAKLRTKNQSDEPIVNENSSTQARPRSGKTRPNSGVKRRSIPSTKDSLLMLHAGSASDDDDGTYGKANDDELENYLAAKTDRKLPSINHTPTKDTRTPSATHNDTRTPSATHNDARTPIATHNDRRTPSATHNDRRTPSATHNDTYSPNATHKHSTLEQLPALDDGFLTQSVETNHREGEGNHTPSPSTNSDHGVNATNRQTPPDKNDSDSSEKNTDDVCGVSPQEKSENFTRDVAVVKLSSYQKQEIGSNGLTIENDDESDEELRILMTKIGDDDPLSSNTNIKEIPSSSRDSTRTKENLVSSRPTESHRTSAISDDVTIMASTSIDIVSDVSKDSINRKTTINSWPDDTPTPSIHQGPSALSDKTNRTSNSGAIKQNESTECHNSHTQSVMEIRRKHTPVEVERKTKSVGDMSEKNESLLQSNPYEAIPVDGKSSTPKRNHKKKSDKGTWGFKNSATPSEVTASQTSVVSSNTRNSRNSEDVNDAESAIINKEEEGSDEELNLDLDNESAYSKSTTGTVDSEELANKENKKPKWHPPWQLKQEVIAHTDAIPVLMIDPSNRWFATGSADRTVKLWDINTCRPKLVIKAHKQSIRAMTFGATGHRQLFTTGDDRQLLCHDVEVNRVTAKFKGQSAVIYGITTYQPSHLLITAARDKLLKIYDTRTTKCVKTLRGHQNTVSCVQAIEETRQIVSGSHDSTLRLWDIGEGRCVNVLQGHVKSVRGLAQHPDGSTILSASSERILAWKLPTGEIVQEIQAENIAINSITINRLGVTVAGGSNGVMHLWDFNSAHRFQKIHRTRVYESQELPICVFAAKFDHTGSKLICSDACNVVKIYREAFTKSRPILDVRYVKPSEEIPLGKNYIVPDSPKKE